MLERGKALAIAVSLLAAGCGSNDQGSSQSGSRGAIEFAASPATVAVGESTWLSWTGQDAASCQASGGWSGEQPATGSFRTAPLTETTTYTIHCASNGNGAMARLTVYVGAASSTEAPQVVLRSKQGSVPANGTTTLEWTAKKAQKCTASGAWSGVKSSKGSERVTGLAANATFTLTCDGPGGTGIAMTEVILQRATLRWVAGTGSSTPGGFRILWGKKSDQPEHQLTINEPTAREQIVDLPGSGTYYFILATLDSNNVETSRSNRASKIIPP